MVRGHARYDSHIDFGCKQGRRCKSHVRAGVCVGEVRLYYIRELLLDSEKQITDFQAKLSQLGDKLRDKEQSAIVGGDVNTKAVDMSIKFADRQRKHILETTVRLDLNYTNVGNTITFKRLGYGAS